MARLAQSVILIAAVAWVAAAVYEAAMPQQATQSPPAAGSCQTTEPRPLLLETVTPATRSWATKSLGDLNEASTYKRQE